MAGGRKWQVSLAHAACIAAQLQCSTLLHSEPSIRLASPVGQATEQVRYESCESRRRPGVAAAGAHRRRSAMEGGTIARAA